MRVQTPSLLERIGKTLHVYVDGFAREPISERWVDLIQRLNDKERLQAKAKQDQRSGRKSTH
jgi:hypothetical protein